MGSVVCNALIRLHVSVVIRYRNPRVSVIIWDGQRFFGLTIYWIMRNHVDKLYLW